MKSPVSHDQPATDTGAKPHLFHFVLLPHFSHLSLISAIETLQNANLVADRKLYDWTLCGTKEQAVRSSIGCDVEVDIALKDVAAARDIVVVSGEHVFELDTFDLEVSLGRLARGNVRVTGLGTGAILMAQAGLMEDVTAAIHSWYRVGFKETYPGVELSRQTHVSESLRCSSSGGVSAIDLFLDFIEQAHGADFASSVAECMCYTPLRQIQKSVDTSIPNSLTVPNRTVSRVIAAMEKQIEEPVSPAVLADQAGISRRQIERLFKKYLGTTPKQHYRKIRLREAYRLLIQSSQPIIDVALATGFETPSHFSRCFKAEFGETPYQLRNRKRTD
ncbi:GlxA family transcriptional regulator [Ruegeria arenilitoris]|uniref:GlxA family transcriptional regulator n=1 Tax=Ruegeria arenilitoris TaxID=1173585 RepID=UPI0014808E3F|nr:helix-turn-helix domain-containing protein [Ruegeria arenilitoris]